jgi:hypothetical protein
MARYLKCGDKLFALNPKVATSAFARAIIARWHPEIEKIITTAAYPDGQSADTGQWQLLVPYRTRPEAEVVCMIREPVDRFRAAMAQVNISDVDATISELVSEAGSHPEYRPVRGRRLLSEDVHFRPQSVYAGNPIRRFRFPDQIEAAAAALDLSLPLVTINEGTGIKPAVTDAQAEAIRAFYSEDVAIWNSLAEASPDA